MTTPTRRIGPLGVMAEQCLARSPRGVVTAAAPAAAHLGATALAAGGNAFDAAVTAALAETVLLPPKCGLGGDLVALAWRATDEQPESLLAIGGAPAGLADVAARGAMETTGPMSVGVPAAPAGYLALAERGRLGIEALAAPAIALADAGFCWSTICSVLAEESLDLVRTHQPGGTRYYPNGVPIAPGAVVALPGLAAALRLLVRDGDSLLLGAFGRAIVDRVAAAGGVLTMGDMSAARAEWTPVAATEVAGHRLWATPAPTHGPSLLDAVAASPTASPAVVLRAVNDAIERRRHDLTDPSGTSMVSAVDADGTLVTVVHSNSFPRFGSGLIVDEFDLILANRAGRGFTSEPGHPNFPVAGRRPATTLHAWGLSAGEWRMLGATPGGANQMPWNAQSLTRIVERADSLDATVIADAVVGARWQHDASGGITIEDGFDDDEITALDVVAPGARRTARWGLRSAMQIVADAGGVRLGVADPRTVGAAVPV